MGNSNTPSKKVDTNMTQADTLEPKKFDYSTKPVPLSQDEMNDWFQIFAHCFNIQKLPSSETSFLTPLHTQYFVSKEHLLKSSHSPSSNESILLKSFLNQIQSSPHTTPNTPKQTIPSIPLSDFLNFASLLSKGSAMDLHSFVFRFLYDIHLLLQMPVGASSSSSKHTPSSKVPSTASTPSVEKILDYDRLVAVFQFLFEQFGISSEQQQKLESDTNAINTTPETCALYVLQTFGNGSSFVDEKSFTANTASQGIIQSTQELHNKT